MPDPQISMEGRKHICLEYFTDQPLVLMVGDISPLPLVSETTMPQDSCPYAGGTESIIDRGGYIFPSIS